MNLKYHKNFLKDLKKIKEDNILENIITFILDLKEEENIYNFQNIKKLTGFNCNYRARIGNYRILFRYEKWNIILDRILHRKDIYKIYP